MTDEVIEQEQNTDAQADGFAAGFKSVAEGTPPEPPAVTPDQPEPDALEAVANDEPVYTRAQIAALEAKVNEVDGLKGQLSKFSGHIGTLLEEVKTLKAKPPEPEKPAPPVIDEAEFDGEYGPNVGAYIRQQVSKGVSVPPELVQRLDATEERAKVAEASSQQLAAELQKTIIGFQHSDWVSIVNDEAYSTWLSTQPEDVKTKAMSPMAAELGSVLSSYKASIAKEQKQKDNKARLEGAYVPTGVPGARPPVPTEEDAFKAGFQSVAARR